MSSSQNFKDLIASKDEEVRKDTSEVPEVVKEAMDTTLTSLAPSVLERGILESILQGGSIKSTAIALQVPESHVRSYLRNPKVKAYMKELKEAVNEIDQMMLTNTLRGMVSARIEEADGDLTHLSNKDTLDVIKVFADITNQISKGQAQEKDDNVFVNIYQQIIGD